ncbi:MAG: GbsR/MarR family transcriptional regulator [Magnetospiraceae bacterium]
MTEIIEHNAKLPEAVEQFVLHWGDLGSQWGVNRSVAQIQALLYLSEKPMTAEEISETLSLARSNVSNSIKELIGWKLIRRVPVFGDRRDHFEAEADLWQILICIAQGRKEREIDPAIAALKDIMARVDDDPTISETSRTRLREMHSFMGTLDSWFGQMLTVPPATLMRLINMGTKVVSILGLGGKDSKKKG